MNACVLEFRPRHEIQEALADDLRVNGSEAFSQLLFMVKRPWHSAIATVAYIDFFEPRNGIAELSMTAYQVSAESFRCGVLVGVNPAVAKTAFGKSFYFPPLMALDTAWKVLASQRRVEASAQRFADSFWGRVVIVTGLSRLH